MGIFLDNRNPYENFREMTSDVYFVDKSMLLQELIPFLGKKNRYFCITRPRRFGKTVMANMVGGFSEYFGFLDSEVDALFTIYKETTKEPKITRDDLALLFAGGAVPADIQEYAAVSMQLSTKDEIYSAMVVYGLLTYENGYVSIPNKELMDSYAAIIESGQHAGRCDPTD